MCLSHWPGSYSCLGVQCHRHSDLEDKTETAFQLTVMVRDLIALEGIDRVFGISLSLLVLSSGQVLQIQGELNQIKLSPRFFPR